MFDLKKKNEKNLHNEKKKRKQKKGKQELIQKISSPHSGFTQTTSSQ